MAVRLRLRIPAPGKRAVGCFRFGLDGGGLDVFPGEPEDYLPDVRQTTEMRRRRDLRLWLFLRSAETRRRVELVHVDDPKAKPKPAIPAAPRGWPQAAEDPKVREKAQAIDAKAAADAATHEKAAKARYDAEHQDEREAARADAKPAAPAEPVVSMATGLPLPAPVPPKGKPQQPPAPAAKLAPTPKGKPAKG
jgi:hypothetical protein